MDNWRGIDEQLTAVFSAINGAGGRAVIVGGYVRDCLRGTDAKDIDIEVFGLDGDDLHALLGRFGDVLTIGRTFGVFKVKGIDVDFSLPRRDSKVAPGHRGFEVTFDPGLDFAEAARRRDFTINSMGWDPLREELLDPHKGRADLEAGRLEVTDPEHFAEDPLRALRGAQFIARFELEPTERLLMLCRSLDLSELAAERVGEEFKKLLTKGVRPSWGLVFLRDSNLLRFFPELEALVGVPQDPERHPEGDVWTHTLLVVDQAAARRGDAVTLPLMLAALCHALGKPGTTEVDAQGRVSAPGHEAAGVQQTRALLTRLAAGNRLTRQVETLVGAHLMPPTLVAERAGPKGYRRLARQLTSGDVPLATLLDLAVSDHLGRATEEALAHRIPWLDAFRAGASGALVDGRAPAPVVTGRHLIERGMTPGPQFRDLLEACQSVQDDTGLIDAEAILSQALDEIGRYE